jgi:hypothetical protein
VTPVLLSLLLSVAPGYARPLETPEAGVVAALLDAHVYEHARRDLADLRVKDASGASVPYLLEWEATASEAPAHPEILNGGFRRGEAVFATLDFREPWRKRCLRLSLSGDNFRRRVSVEGSDDGRSWTTLTDEAWVFAIPAPVAARYESVPLPLNDYRLLRVTVRHGPDDPARIEIRDAWAPQVARWEPASRSLEPRWSRSEDVQARETRLFVDLGARRQPFRAVVVDADADRFFRPVIVEARRDPRRPQDPPVWERIGEAALSSGRADDPATHRGRIELRGRERVLRLRIQNGDDRPLGVRGVRVEAPRERVVFEAREGGRYRLTYGDATARAPQFDLARRLDDPVGWASAASELQPGVAEPLPAGPEPLRPWTERHPRLLWFGLIGAILLLGGVTWRALRGEAPGPTQG